MNMESGPDILTGEDFNRLIKECYWDYDRPLKKYSTWPGRMTFELKKSSSAG